MEIREIPQRFLCNLYAANNCEDKVAQLQEK